MRIISADKQCAALMALRRAACRLHILNQRMPFIHDDLELLR